MTSRQVLTLLAVAACLVALSLHGTATAAADGYRNSPFQLADYFRAQRVVELALSSDGAEVAYIAEVRSLQRNSVSRSAYLQNISPQAKSRAIPAVDDARDLVWVPGTREVAFLSSRTGVTQVFSWDTRAEKLRQLTFASDPVRRFQVARRRVAVAYSTRERTDSLYNRLRRDGSGILIDTDTTGYMDIVDASRGELVNANPIKLFVMRAGERAIEISLPGDVRDFHWSSDAKFLSVTYVGQEVPASEFRSHYTSVGLIDASTGDFTPFATAAGERSSARMFSGGEWIPDQRKMVIRRATESNVWKGGLSFYSLALADTEAEWDESRLQWLPIEVYPRGSKFTPASKSRLLIETRSRGVDGLLDLKDGIQTRADLGPRIEGSSSLFRFSSDFKTVAFVNESMTRPPEVYVHSIRGVARQLTTLNEELSHARLPRLSEITWSANDGVRVSGWLLAADESEFPQPWPLITYVHGGPGYAFPDRFGPVLETWPHPLEIFALNGLAVFIPQYRGTLSYGKEVAFPTRVDKEPIDDIVAGIELLVRNGIADSTRLGIAGYSHGAWLGPMVATRKPMFRAGSFAEGWSSQITVYELSPGMTNRHVHERGVGEPALYEYPERYLELSPDLHFRGMTMATLFESGAEATALEMLGMAKAARYHGLPNELVLYPNTPHVMSIPALQLESAERNLDWFLFWLSDKEDDDAGKVETYVRWRAMRDRVQGRRPTSAPTLMQPISKPPKPTPYPSTSGAKLRRTTAQ